jgi:hypothetical protein
MPCAHRGAPAPYGFAFFTSRHPLWIAISLPSPKSEPGKYRLRWCAIRARIWSPRNGVHRSFCTAIILRSPCRLWVSRYTLAVFTRLPLCPRFQTYWRLAVNYVRAKSEHHVMSAPPPVCPREPAWIPSSKRFKENAAEKRAARRQECLPQLLGFCGRLSRHISQVGLIVVRRT